MARWIVKWSAAAAPAVPAVAPVQLAPAAAPSNDAVTGFSDLMTAAKLTGAVFGSLLSDILALGAVDIVELCLQDWQALLSWKILRPLEMRRLANAVQ